MNGQLNLVDVGAEALELQHGIDRRLGSRTAAAGPQPAAAHPPDSSASWTLYSLVLGPAERSALIRTLEEVKAGRSLDSVEQRMLERLEWAEHRPAVAGLLEL